MRLMGATEATIRGPFLFAVALPAAAAAVLAVVVTVASLAWVGGLASPLGVTVSGPAPTTLVVEALAALLLPLAAALVTLERYATAQ